MRVYKLKLDGYNGPCIYDDMKDFLNELEYLLKEDYDCKIEITSMQMSKEGFDALPDFEGY